MKVGVVGTGFVGSTAAFALIMHGVEREVVLVDRNMERAGASSVCHTVRTFRPRVLGSGTILDTARFRS